VKPHVVPEFRHYHSLSVDFRAEIGGRWRKRLAEKGNVFCVFYFVRLAHPRVVRVLQRALVLQADVVRLESI
jgi:hypothetical protein